MARRPRTATQVAWASVALALLASCGRDTAGSSGDFHPATAGTLTVAAAIPSPGFWNGDTPAAVDGGFEYGIAHELADRLDLDHVTVVAAPIVDLIDGRLPAGADLALSRVTITSEREKKVDFSEPYYAANVGVVVRHGDDVPDLNAAREERWGAVADSTNLAFVERVIDPDDAAQAFPDVGSLLNAVADGTVDAALVDLPVALARTNGSPRLTVVSQFLTGDQYGAVLPNGSANLQAVDAAFRAMEADGTLASLEKQWLLPAFGRDPANIPVIVTRSPR